MKRGPLAAALLTLLQCGSALAHAPIENVSAFYNGMLHPVLVPAHLLAILVLGLLLGQHGLSAMRYALPVFLISLVCGLAASGSFGEAVLERWLLATVVLCGLIVIAALEFHAALAAAPALLLGNLIGLDSPAAFPVAAQRLLMLCGVCLGAGLLVLFASGISEQLHKPWQRIGLRVLGSWVTSGAILVLAFDMSRRIPAG